MKRSNFLKSLFLLPAAATIAVKGTEKPKPEPYINNIEKPEMSPKIMEKFWENSYIGNFPRPTKHHVKTVRKTGNHLYEFIVTDGQNLCRGDVIQFTKGGSGYIIQMTGNIMFLQSSHGFRGRKSVGTNDMFIVIGRACKEI